MGKKEFCDETDLQKESDHYHDTGSHDRGGGIPELLVEEGSGGAEVYEAGMMDISDSDILAENQAKSGVDDGSLTEIASLDGDGEKLPDGNEVAAVPEECGGFWI